MKDIIKTHELQSNNNTSPAEKISSNCATKGSQKGIFEVIIISSPRHKRRLAFINALQHVRSDSYQL